MRAHILAALTAIVLYSFPANGPWLKDLNGQSVQPVGDGVSVLVFTRSDCPISNRYMPELARIAQQPLSRGVKFWLVYVNDQASKETLRRNSREYGIPFPALIDDRQEAVKFAGVRTTPEVAVYYGGALIYRGRIDNRYASVGVKRSVVTEHDVENVLSALAQHRRPAFRSTTAIGCAIGDVP